MSEYRRFHPIVKRIVGDGGVCLEAMVKKGLSGHCGAPFRGFIFHLHMKLRCHAKTMARRVSRLVNIYYITSACNFQVKFYKDPLGLFFIRREIDGLRRAFSVEKMRVM